MINNIGIKTIGDTPDGRDRFLKISKLLADNLYKLTTTGSKSQGTATAFDYYKHIDGDFDYDHLKGYDWDALKNRIHAGMKHHIPHYVLPNLYSLHLDKPDFLDPVVLTREIIGHYSIPEGINYTLIFNKPVELPEEFKRQAVSYIIDAGKFLMQPGEVLPIEINSVSWHEHKAKTMSKDVYYGVWENGEINIYRDNDLPEKYKKDREDRDI